MNTYRKFFLTAISLITVIMLAFGSTGTQVAHADDGEDTGIIDTSKDSEAVDDWLNFDNQGITLQDVDFTYTAPDWVVVENTTSAIFTEPSATFSFQPGLCLACVLGQVDPTYTLRIDGNVVDTYTTTDWTSYIETVCPNGSRCEVEIDDYPGWVDGGTITLQWTGNCPPEEPTPEPEPEVCPPGTTGTYPNCESEPESEQPAERKKGHGNYWSKFIKPKHACESPNGFGGLKFNTDTGNWERHFFPESAGVPTGDHYIYPVNKAGTFASYKIEQRTDCTWDASFIEEGASHPDIARFDLSGNFIKYITETPNQSEINVGESLTGNLICAQLDNMSICNNGASYESAGMPTVSQDGSKVITDDLSRAYSLSELGVLPNKSVSPVDWLPNGSGLVTRTATGLSILNFEDGNYTEINGMFWASVRPADGDHLVATNVSDNLSVYNLKTGQVIEVEDSSGFPFIDWVTTGQQSFDEREFDKEVAELQAAAVGGGGTLQPPLLCEGYNGNSINTCIGSDDDELKAQLWGIVGDGSLYEQLGWQNWIILQAVSGRG